MPSTSQQPSNRSTDRPANRPTDQPTNQPTDQPRQRKRTRHVAAVGKEVRRIGDQQDKGTLDAGEAAHVGVLEQQGGADADRDADQQADGEDQEEDADALEQAADGGLAGAMELLGGLEHDDGDGVVEDALAKDDGVELGIDLVGVEDGQDGDRVGG